VLLVRDWAAVPLTVRSVEPAETDTSDVEPGPNGNGTPVVVPPTEPIELEPRLFNAEFVPGAVGTPVVVPPRAPSEDDPEDAVPLIAVPPAPPPPVLPVPCAKAAIGERASMIAKGIAIGLWIIMRLHGSADNGK
jgi:hypothetical protein